MNMKSLILIKDQWLRKKVKTYQVNCVTLIMMVITINHNNNKCVDYDLIGLIVYPGNDLIETI